MLAGAIALRAVPSGFLPTMDEGAFVLDYFLPAGTSLGETDAVARKIEAELRRTPEVATYSRRTGAELGPATATLISRGDIMVRLKPAHERKRSADEVIASVRAAVARNVPEARSEYVQVLQDVLNDLAGTPRPIEIKIFGEDDATLRRLGAEIVGRIRDVPGLVDLYPGFEDESPELHFRIDPEQAARLGRTAADVAADLETTLRGTVAAVFRRPDRPINVRVRYPDDVRFDPARVAALALAWSPAGTTPVAAAAPAERIAIPTQRTRENLRRVVIVTADHEERDLGSVVRDVQKRLAGLALPEGYRIELGGQFEGQERTFREVGLVLAFGLLAVAVVLMAQFRRARLAALVLATAPLAIVGALLTLLVADVPLNASSLMGCVLLVGLVVKNGILLLEQFELHHGRGASARRRAAGGRLAARAADPDDHHRDPRRPRAAGAGCGRGCGDPAPAGDRGDRRAQRLDGHQSPGPARAGSPELVVSRRRAPALNKTRPSADAMCARRAPMDISPSRPPDGNLLARGATIGRFQVISLVGKGGMGEVYAAYDPELDRNVAIKLLRAGKNSDSDEGRARMMREAQATARVSHPNVVIVYDAGTFQDRVFIAMEFVEGHTLGYWMHARSRSWPEVLEVFAAAGRGLAAAHERDLVHRDFKPDNVMIGADGQVRVMDFGLVQIAGERNTEADADADGYADGDGRVQAADDDVTAEHSAPRNGRAGSGPDGRDRAPRRRPRRPAHHAHAQHRTRRLARPSQRSQPQPHALRRQHGNAGVHVARTIPRRAHRRRDRPVQLLRRALRGAVRRAAVLGPHARRPGQERRRRFRAHGAGGLARARLDPRGAAARAGGEPGRALAVDDRAAGAAGAAAGGRQPPPLRRRRRRQAGRRVGGAARRSPVRDSHARRDPARLPRDRQALREEGLDQHQPHPR